MYARYGYLDRALEQFAGVIEKQEFLPAMLNMATLLTRQGRPEEALEYLERSRAGWPDNPRVHLGLAISHLENGNRRSAEQAYRQIELLDPDLAEAYPLFGSEGGSTARAGAQDTVEKFLAGGWVEPE